MTGMGKKTSNISGAPKPPLRPCFDMSMGDVEPMPDYSYKPRRKQKIECRLLIKKYPTRKQAKVRCKQIHGKTFEGEFQSGRYWVFWSYER
jgi:hypothetical protein